MLRSIYTLGNQLPRKNDAFMMTSGNSQLDTSLWSQIPDVHGNGRQVSHCASRDDRKQRNADMPNQVATRILNKTFFQVPAGHS